jgi:hypothetical protein
LKPNDAEVRTNYSVLARRTNLTRRSGRLMRGRPDPKSPEGQQFQRHVTERAANHDEALREFRKRRLRPDFGLAHLNAGLILAAKRETAAAEQHLRVAAKSDDPAIQKKAAAALQQLGIRR